VGETECTNQVNTFCTVIFLKTEECIGGSYLGKYG